ncbi:hypothetical protein [Dyadobacter pollutisoli]|jgi:hypothetical protein|uniref:Uncharacterized protein n=1 Tax=Dyadobacter pollutisoli TaxID=2910158 RepID=A0A9E8NBW5_9BACT|nr:hypothetical protein [Dyadobacter pollutisoli]WAC13133.1 hypothetical protein ON006_04045 [Dyadobacter pollutisoli]
MLTEFELLIRELESEKLRLDEELQECLQVQDYKYAHFFQKGIWRIERRIKQLQQLYHNPTALDTQHLVDAIVELDKGKIKGFSVFFLSKSDFYLHFYKLPGRGLYCQIPTEDEMLKAHYYAYMSGFKKNILALGFNLEAEKPGIEFRLEANHSCNEILGKLALLMFDILHVSPQASGYITRQFH